MNLSMVYESMIGVDHYPSWGPMFESEQPRAVRVLSQNLLLLHIQVDFLYPFSSFSASLCLHMHTSFLSHGTV